MQMAFYKERYFCFTGDQSEAYCHVISTIIICFMDGELSLIVKTTQMVEYGYLGRDNFFLEGS